MRDVRSILVFGVLVAGLASLLQSGVWLTFLMMSLYAVLLAQSWNILGGYGGQLSFGHALFFGVGAYAQAIAQLTWGWNPWLALPFAIAAGIVVGLIVGALTFRSGLKGSYFALVTLAFAEVFRIVASVAPVTGAGVGLLVKLDLRPEAFQFQSRVPFYLIAVALTAVSMIVVRLIEDSRFGAYLVALRENEEAAKALGVN